jgi:4-amino-4-deoxy-L-arabinose transferase-like glycosyltransferase
MRAGSGSATVEHERIPSWLPVLVLTLLAAALRFTKLGHWSAWGDEIYTFTYAEESQEGMNPAPLRTMPLAFLPTRLALILFGSPASEFSIRFFPALFGTLLIPILYAVLRPRFGRREAAIAALLATFAPWLLYQSQFARYYSLLLLLSAASAFLYLDAARSQSRKTMAMSAVCFALAGLTHPTAFFLLPVFALHVLITRPFPSARSALRIMLPFVLVLGCVVVAALLNQDALRRTIGYSLDLRRAGTDNAFDIVQGLAYNLGIQVAFLSVIGLALLWREDRGIAIFLLLMTAIPFVIVVALATLGRAVEERYLIPSLGAYFVLAARPVAELDSALQRVRPRLAPLALVAALVPFLPGVVSHYRDGDRHDMRSAAKFVRERMSPTDLIVAEAHRLFAWYAGYREYEVLEAPPEPSRPKIAKKVQKYSSGALWVVIPDEFEHSPGPEGEFARWTVQHCQLVAEFHTPRYDYHQNSLRVFRREHP